MATKVRKSPGTAGMGNTALHSAMVEIRRSSAAQPHRNRKRYHRASARLVRD